MVNERQPTRQGNRKNFRASLLEESDEAGGSFTLEELRQWVAEDEDKVKEILHTILKERDLLHDERTILEKTIEQQKAQLSELSGKHETQGVELKREREKSKQLLEWLSSSSLPPSREPSVQSDNAIRQHGSYREERDITPGSAIGGKSSRKFPDPPILEDGKKPTFRVWNSQLRNKLSSNADWFVSEDPEDPDKVKVAYIETRVDGKAAEHLYPWLEARRDVGKVISVKDVIQFLENVFEDPDRRLKARQELKKLKMSHAGDFTDFKAEFVRLTNIAKIPRGQWKEEIHDKLYSDLQVQMEDTVADEDIDFDEYCKRAQNFARGLARKNKERQERRSKQPPFKKSDRSAEKEVSTRTTATASMGKKPTYSDDVVCYACDQKGHIASKCPNKKAETKVIEKAEDEDFMRSDSEKDQL